MVGDPRDARRCPVHEVDRLDSLLDMKLARHAVGVDPPPVADPVSGVAVLLDFEDQVAAADRVQRAGGDEIGVSRQRRIDLKQVLDIRRIQHAHQLLAGCPALEPGENLRAFAGGDDVPHFGFRLRTAADFGAGGFVGMDLETQAVTRVDQLHQKRKTVDRFRLPPDQLASVMLEQFM
ncbi:hypothetical protein SDC9_197057 [bioreactor metagenome]|uniref:Uncharacterized protein n=1 Tax=bioreactor metagenome TaxID=1076179 RepID=A0A645IES0_9ZZZZ